MPPSISLSPRVSRLKPPATLAIMARAKALAKSGANVISFGLGEPDFDTPQPIRQAAIDALESGQTHYMPTVGDLDTRAAIADKLARENNLPGITPDHVTISAGAKHSLFLVCQCLLDADGPNEVLLPVPAWVSYGPIASLAGGKVVELPASPDNGFRITPDQLRAAISPRSRLLILNTPSNPCGTMYAPDDLRALARVVADAARSIAPNLVVVVDEIYEKIIYGSVPHFSIGSVPEIADRTVTINGLSKAFAMTGWRVGYAACSGDFGLTLARGIDALQGQMTSCITSFLYPAIRVALRDCANQTEHFRQQFARRAAIAFDLISKTPGVVCSKPTGAFYLFPDIAALYGKSSPAGKRITSGIDFAEALLNEAHVAVVPGQEFGGCGHRHIRISFACSEAQLAEGLQRLARFVASLR